MRAFYLFSCLTVACVMARPEPPVYVGLQQQNQRALPLSVHSTKPHDYQPLPQEHSFANFAATNPAYGAPAADPSPDTLSPATAETPVLDMPQEDSYNAAYHHSTNQHNQIGYDNGPTETQVHKHIYVHVPPKDFEDAVQPRVKHQGSPKQKHYKIVFIKAPDAPNMRAPIVPPAPQNEEKTLIYVLHKKPETQPDIVIPTPAPTKPSKPEVYFIKYKTKKDETPVYGPPPATIEVETRQAADNDYSVANDIMPMDHSQYEMAATTQQPEYQGEEEEQLPLQTQLLLDNEESSLPNTEFNNDPNITNFISSEVQPTAAEPLKQYLPPVTTSVPIVVEELEEPAHVPVVNYGPPNRTRFFVKKRK